jgi:glycosyltransferase involved in cell wall biosynthesis
VKKAKGRSRMNEYLVTVLMPLKHFHLYFLKRAAESVIKQSCPNWHMIIVVEKGDSDNFRRPLEKELKDPRIRVITNEGRKLSGAINTGMRHAKTEFVSLLLADDMWSNNAVEILNDYIVKYPHIDFFHSSRIYIDENDNPISSVYYSKQEFSIDDFKLKSPVKHLLCWRKDKALSFGGLDESLNSVGSDDYDFPWAMAEKGASFKAVRECLYYYRDHRECYRLTTHLPLSVHKREIRRIMKKHGVDALTIRERIAGVEKTYLRQCLFKSESDKRIKEKLGYDARQGWREKYR